MILLVAPSSPPPLSWLCSPPEDLFRLAESRLNITRWLVPCTSRVANQVSQSVMVTR